MDTKATFRTDTYQPDRLHGGNLPILGKKRTLISGEANRTRGAVLGRTATAATVGAAVADAGNTGNGVLTLAGPPAFDGKVKEGNYRIVFIEPAANAGTFAVEDPEGHEIGRGNVGVAFSNQILFTIADGAADFVSGDSFTITVSAITYKYKLAAAAAVDGSADAVEILAEDCDATAADTDCVTYTRGDFTENALSFGAGHTADTVREALRRRNIHLVKSVAD